MEILKEKVAVAVVTFNRLDLLKKVINGIRNQTKMPDLIVVVNNSSTDGTSEWLVEQSDLHVVTQDNLGSSGGQFTSIKTCYELGYDWIWIMDDDVVPRKDCLAELFNHRDEKKILAPLRFTPDNVPFINDTIEFNLSNPFASFWKRIISENDLNQEVINADGITFEGPFFHRGLVYGIGLPEKKFFIYADDTEYFIRAKKAGYSMHIVKKAEMDRLLHAPNLEQEFSWKNFYIIRNIMACDVLQSTLPVRIIRPVIYLFKWLMRAKTSEDRNTVWKAFRNGYFYKSDN